MRRKKTREVNIYSASVVDLFASGLGVFLIVSIIALVNQKKESSKAMAEGSASSVQSDMEDEIEGLSQKLQNLSNENVRLKAQQIKTGELPKSTGEVMEQRVNLAVAESKLIRSEKENKIKVKKLNEKLTQSQKTIKQLKQALITSELNAQRGEKGVGTNFNQFEVGSKIILQDVHFYPGTDRAIEPYASREISDFSKFMKKNPNITVEVSGHIFETKKAIESGKANDGYNLSGRRANFVCDKLIEFGVADKRFSCVGYGVQRQLVLTNDQYSEDAQKNRRVEIEIISK